MSFLGTSLALDEGSRLTGVGIEPLAYDLRHRNGSVYAHYVSLAGIEDADSTSGAVTRFLPSSVASIHGSQLDGSSWFVVFQIAPADAIQESSGVRANDGVRRALALCRVNDKEVAWRGFTADELRDVYLEAEAGSVADWSVSDLLVGLVIELTGTGLADVVDDASHHPVLEGDDLADQRIEHLCARLDDWAGAGDAPR